MNPRISQATLLSFPILSISLSMSLSSAGALAQTGAPSGELPSRRVPSTTPEEDAGCPVPTLADCQDPDFLLELRGCGAVQNSPDAACMSLMLEEVDSQADDAVVEIVPKSFVASGVGKVVKHPPDAPQTRTYAPDLYSFASRTAARDLGGSDQIGIDLYAQWRGNGSVITTCEEYAFEKFYDVNEYLRIAGPSRATAGEMVDVAFGPAYERSSIGNRHLADANLRGYDGRIFGKTIAGLQRQKNRFFAMKNYPSQNSEGFGINGAPPLLDSLTKRSLLATLLLGKIQTARQSGSIITETWSWHKETALKLRANPDQPAYVGPNQILNNNGNNDDDHGFDLAVLGTTGGPTPTRKRLDKELDELYRLQVRLDALQKQWSDADVRFEGSGWDVDEAGLAHGGLLITPNTNTLLAPQAGFNPPNQFAPVLKVVVVPQQPNQVGGISLEDPETVIRRQILDELLEVLKRADADGCLNAGLTACDWSPQLFSERAGIKLTTAQDAAYSFCNELTLGSIQNVEDLDYAFVDDDAPQFQQYNCSVHTGSTITAYGLEKLATDVEFCREKQVAYLEAKALEEAKNRVRDIPDLIDPATGEFKFPGGRKSRDELMGNDRVGLKYSYDFGFLMEAEEEICRLTVDVGGDLYAAVNALVTEIVLLDARAWASTVTQDIDVHAKIIDKSIFIPKDLFTPINESFDDLEPIEFNVAKTPQKSKDVQLVKTTFVIVVVPLSLEIGVSGKLGAKLGVQGVIVPPNNDVCPSVEVNGLVEPFLGVDAYLAAAIDVFIAAAGVRGDINLITVSLPFTPGVAVRQLGGIPVPENFEIEISADLDLALSTMSGRIQAFAEIGFCPFCADVERTVVEWQGPQWNQNLFSQSYVVNLGDLGTALFQ